MVVEPDKSIILGGSWRIPVLTKLYDKGYIDDIKNDPTYNPLSFDREFENRILNTVNCGNS